MSLREIEVLVRCPKGWHPKGQTAHYEDIRDCERCDFYRNKTYIYNSSYPQSIICIFNENNILEQKEKKDGDAESN